MLVALLLRQGGALEMRKYSILQVVGVPRERMTVEVMHAAFRTGALAPYHVVEMAIGIVRFGDVVFALDLVVENLAQRGFPLSCVKTFTS